MQRNYCLLGPRPRELEPGRLLLASTPRLELADLEATPAARQLTALFAASRLPRRAMTQRSSSFDGAPETPVRLRHG